MFPALEGALKTARPEALELDATGAHAFLKESAAILEAAGFGVLAPNLAASNVATLVASVVLGVALFAETLGRGAIGLALSVLGLVLMAAGILALARGGVAPSVVPGVATAIEGAIEAAEAKATRGKATEATTFGPEATEAETSDVEVAQPGAATPDRQSTSLAFPQRSGGLSSPAPGSSLHCGRSVGSDASQP